MATTSSYGVRTLLPAEARNSSDATSARSVALMSVPEARKTLGQVGDQGLRRIVADEPHGELAGDGPGRRRVVRQVAQVRRGHRAAVRGGVGMAEAEHADGTHRVGFGVVVGLEGAWIVHRPAGQDLGRVLHHVLGVARVRTDRVQLEQFAAVVLVGRIAHGLGVVEVEQHRRLQADRGQQLVEPAQGVGPDHGVVLLATEPGLVGERRHVEVVRPQVHHVLEHGPGREHRGAATSSCRTRPRSRERSSCPPGSWRSGWPSSRCGPGTRS